MQINFSITAASLAEQASIVAALAGRKTKALLKRWPSTEGAPVTTVAGKYTSRSWTNWTHGFLFGNALLAFELTDDEELLRLAKEHIRIEMPVHITHTGVHDHGFNSISTYGNLRRLMRAKRIVSDDAQLEQIELALKVSGAVQAGRWTSLPNGAGYIYSFNGAHSLFVDTFRTLRICGLAHVLGQRLLGEQDLQIDLLQRTMTHARTSARYNIFYGEGRDIYDTELDCGRTVHEAIFNPASGAFRCPSSQQGYSPFSTWTRGLAWAMLGATEQIEFLESLSEGLFSSLEDRQKTLDALYRAAQATCNFFIDRATTVDGICYWDTGAPGLGNLGDWRAREAEPRNSFEPVDSSASAIGAQGLLRLGRILGDRGKRYTAAGLTVAHSLFSERYLSLEGAHEGLLLHTIYHQPNGWDNSSVAGVAPHGESSMWGDYHLLELALLVTRLANGTYYTFFE
jgi:unsaturated chondroitin disaccharide hydrolase